MTEDEAGVAGLIREAFRGVTLGEGVGLRQGQGLDDYADQPTLATLRAQDEKMDWSAIPAEELNRCSSSLSFFDAEGMRFHLPAFLIAELEGTYKQDMIFHLTYLNDYGRSRYAALNIAQRMAVRGYLLLRLTQCGFETVQEMIETALCEFWTEAA